MDCLASRVELGQHRATHKYRLVDNGGLQLLGRSVFDYYLVQVFFWKFVETFFSFFSNWTCKELVQLLDGIEQFGKSLCCRIDYNLSNYNIQTFLTGHGNWVDVSRYVASPSKGPAECREAVNNFFVSSAIGD